MDPRWSPLLVNESGDGPIVSHVHLAATKLWSRAPFAHTTRRSILALRRSLRETSYRAVVDVQGTLRSAVIGSFAHAEVFAGFRDPREAVAGPFYGQRLRRRGTHVVEQVAALLGETLGVPLQTMRSVPLPRQAEPERWAEAFRSTWRQSPGKRVVMLSPAAGWGAKQWPAKHFGELARRLGERGFGVLVNAAHQDDTAATEVMRLSAGGAQMAVCNVAQLVALTRRVAVVVGHDSGPAHLAAAIGIPVVALYGPTDPARNGPWGEGPICVLRHPSSLTSHKRLPATDPGLAQIGVDEVLASVVAISG